jgi:prevent-host-death family protein
MEITAANFRSNIFKILDEIDQKHIDVVITKRGKPVAKLVHIEADTLTDPLLGTLPNAGFTVGDLTQPSNHHTGGMA